MKFAIRSTDLNTYGYTVVAASKLLVINFNLKKHRTPNVVSGHEYPHISIYCSYLTEMGKAYGSEITAQFDAFHISFSDSHKVWKLVTPGSAADTPVLITDDKSKDSATLGVTATVGTETWSADDICTKFLLPVLAKRVVTT